MRVMALIISSGSAINNYNFVRKNAHYFLQNMLPFFENGHGVNPHAPILVF
jgi:hypothetical protein